MDENRSLGDGPGDPRRGGTLRRGTSTSRRGTTWIDRRSRNDAWKRARTTNLRSSNRKRRERQSMSMRTRTTFYRKEGLNPSPSPSKKSGTRAIPRRRTKGIYRTVRSTTSGARRAIEDPALETSTSGDQSLMDELKSFLEEDLRNLFEDKGIDESKYEEEMEFEDPITSYRTLSGYLLNIQMLRYLFNPKFQLHSVTQTGEHELTTRWTMEMEFMGKFVPQGLWRPQLAWTGLSIMQVNPQTGKFCKHVDIWDSIKDNSYFSLEGLQDLIRQLTQFYRTPDLETPAYTVLRRFKDYEIRSYKSFKVAESKADNQMARGEAFMKLAGFIYGENEEKRKVAMTTPVFFTGDTLQFVLGSDTGDDGLTPVRDDIACTSMQGGVYACLKFNGLATEEEARERASELRQLLKESGYEAVGEEIVARYNDPSTLPFVRRNEVIIPLGITPESLLV